MMVGLRDYVDAQRLSRRDARHVAAASTARCRAAVAVDALGPDKVWCVMLPSQIHLDRKPRGRRRERARLLGCRHDVIPIVPGVEALDAMLAESRRALAAENIQSRLRMVTLMALSNSHGHMLLTTGNKSEMSVGYATLYGDMAGGYSVLKDAYKTTVFALSRWRNANRPDRRCSAPTARSCRSGSSTSRPRAELRPDQKDEDSLPPYALLDRILEALVEQELSVAEAAARDRRRARPGRRHREEIAARRI